MTQNTQVDTSQHVIYVEKSATQAHCPPDDYPLWSQHPRVYIDLSKEDEAICPYCGNRFVKK